jgi:histidyl-tRNA synthetase
MLKNRRDTAYKVVNSLRAAEAAIDAALARAAELNATLVNARIEANFSAVVGQDAFEGAAAAFAALARARADMVETHNRLEQTRIRMRMPAVASGDGKDPPMAIEPTPLRAVG